MMRKFFCKKPTPPSQQQQQKHQQPQQTEPTYPRTTSPLDILELREHIFSYLDNADLRRSVLPVCREWFWIYRHLFEKETVWDIDLTSTPLSNKTIKNITGSGRLHWHYGPKCISSRLARNPKQKVQWNELVRALEKNHTRYLQTRRRRKTFHRKLLDDVSTAIFDNPLRHFDFIAFQSLDSLIPTILPFLTFLTTLRLRSRAFGLVSLNAVLEACPLLETFQAGVLGVILELPGPWIPANKKDSGPVRLPLRSFELENATFEYSNLTSLLTVCPSLKNLRLINIMFMERIDNHPSTLETLQGIDSVSAPYITQRVINPKDHATSLLEHIKQLRLQLRSFHISVYAARTLDLKPGAISSVCPEAAEWTFWTVGLTDTISKELALLTNNVTALDFLWDAGSNGRWGITLHQYLCQSPHLLHLRAPKTRFQVEHLDLHNRLSIPVEVDGSRVVPGIWRCRRLRTLQVSLEWNIHYYENGPTATRIVFGYLSRVCPQLEELHLSSKRRDMYERKLLLWLEGGICLLANLRHLKRLHVGSGYHHFTSEAWELSWMTPSGLNLDHRRARQARMVSWEADILQEERDELGSTRAEEGAVGGLIGIAARDTALEEELRNLGKKADVKSMLEQIDSGRFREVIWDTGVDPTCQEAIASRLLGAGRLWWYSRRHPTGTLAGPDRWVALVKALK
ncbi:hypothetical protein KI688_000969 [Linnemannia hyalina]|uniref:F-box domain-containing protein n=1 Tax=Linnemannia hyalina TaxID=64524 RepID=A0A9P8C062_9FUNG|nr:hypothetical protein KI688_000969 [Linnemannia hyalina]